jgi:hypothetical protein
MSVFNHTEMTSLVPMVQAMVTTWQPCGASVSVLPALVLVVGVCLSAGWVSGRE